LSEISDDEFNKIFIKPLNNNYNSIKPFEQLMLVLPRQLAYLLPPVLKYKMNNDAIIKKHAPYVFEQDMLYKTKLWQAIPKIDMVPLDYVLSILKTVKLDPVDEKRNKTMKIYRNDM
jgi:5'-3' exonuclease